MSDMPLEDLPFEELRHRAFHVAEHRLDLGFFVDVYYHMPGMVTIEGEGGDLGSTGGTIIESITDRLFTFDDNTIVLPGHGNNTTIGAERPHLDEWIERGW